VVSDDKVRGHDSKEDANAAGDLVRYMVGTEWAKMKRHGWTLENGQFMPPKGGRDVSAEEQSMLTVDFLEMKPTDQEGKDASHAGMGTDIIKGGTKRPIAEISGDDL
jgi:hypothetical protein